MEPLVTLPDLNHLTTPGALERVDPRVIKAFLLREGGVYLLYRISSRALDGSLLRHVIEEADQDFPLQLADALMHVEGLASRLFTAGDSQALERALRLWLRDPARVRELLDAPPPRRETRKGWMSPSDSTSPAYGTRWFGGPNRHSGVSRRAQKWAAATP